MNKKTFGTGVSSSLESTRLLDSLPPMSMDIFMEMSGLSPATCWRYRKRGWLQTVTIAGRHYITREAIADFNRRAAAGEFAGKVANPSAYRNNNEELLKVA